MAEEERPDRRAIYVPDDVAEAAGVPDDLDSEVDDFNYSVPDTKRRRRSGFVYLIGAAGVAALIVGGLLPSAMWWTAVAVLIVVAGYHFVSGWGLGVREAGALEAAGREVPFAVGHASASLGFTGWRARPVWNVLVFSADEPPSSRALVRVDGTDGSVVDSYIEDVPEV